MEKKEKLIIIVDTREQQPLIFRQFPEVVTIRRKLDAGDYSIEGYEDKICVERKNSIDELCTAIGKGRINFEEEMERAKKFDAFFLIVEGSPIDFLFGNYERSHLNPHSARASICDWVFQYNIRPIFVSSPMEASMWVVELFKKYLKNKKEGKVKDVVVNWEEKKENGREKGSWDGVWNW